MSDTETFQDDRRARFAETLNRLERAYLSLVRAIVLVAATLLILFAAWLGVSGLYKSSLSVKSVKEAIATVAPQEVTQIDIKAAARAGQDAFDPLAEDRRFFAGFSKRYFSLYRSKFERFKKPDDRALDQESFEDRFLTITKPPANLEEISLTTAPARADLEQLLTAMAAASDEKNTTERLRTYRNAKKIKVTRRISDTREESYCEYFSEYSGDCLITGSRTIPFTRVVEDLRLPDGVISHQDLFGAYQDRFLALLNDRRRENGATAT